jgi:hypothetical protein
METKRRRELLTIMKMLQVEVRGVFLDKDECKLREGLITPKRLLRYLFRSNCSKMMGYSPKLNSGFLKTSVTPNNNDIAPVKPRVATASLIRPSAQDNNNLV